MWLSMFVFTQEVFAFTNFALDPELCVSINQTFCGFWALGFLDFKEAFFKTPLQNSCRSPLQIPAQNGKFGWRDQIDLK